MTAHPAVATRFVLGSMAKNPTLETVLEAYAELRAIGIKKVHINTLRQQMIASGFDRKLSCVCIGDVVGDGFLAFKNGYVAMRVDT